jgi:hypothetical protein
MSRIGTGRAQDRPRSNPDSSHGWTVADQTTGVRFLQVLTSISDHLKRCCSPSGEPLVSRSTPVSDHAEFGDLLEAVGATSHESDHESELALRDAAIRELEGMLGGLRSLGDELAKTEQERLALAARLAELEGSSVTIPSHSQQPDHLADRLENKLAQREAVLARERSRHAATRDKLAASKRVAGERWQLLRELRAENRRLRIALEDRASQPPR